MEINSLNKLIEPYLEPNQKFMSYECKNLLPIGENYGSTMLQISVKVINGEGKEEIIQCVCKSCPPSEFLWEFFCTRQTFKKEIALYTIVVPAINSFAKEKGLDNLLSFFAKCLGARLSLDTEKDEVDKDACLVLENLKIQGYEMSDRCIGFDLECAQLLLNNLAVMHAAGIAFKSAKPNEFKKILPYLKKEYVFFMQEDLIDGYIKSIQDALRKDPQCVLQFSKIDKAVRDMKYFVENPPKGKEELFATITHNDFWTNNTMIKYENGKPVKNKMVDFQLLEYNSLAHDVIFFLYSSVEISVLEKHVDKLMRYYYDKFVQTLASLKHDISPYSFEIMMQEFAVITRDFEFSHLLYMMCPLMTLKGKAKVLDQFSKKDFFVNTNLLHENYFKRTRLFLLDFAKKGWI